MMNILLFRLNLIFSFVLRSIKENFLFILFFILFAITVTILVAKIRCFKTIKSAKRLLPLGVWLIPINIIFSGLKEPMLNHIGASSMYGWVKITLKIFPIIFAILSIIFIVSGICIVIVKTKKEKSETKKTHNDSLKNVLD